ncbi:MAG: phosphatase domain-containing protein [Bdellovibrionia bacterium]
MSTVLTRSVWMPWVALAFSSVALAQAPQSAQMPHRLIVTDVDDTVKLTDNTHTIDSAIRAAFSRKAFAGISTLFKELQSRSEPSGLFEHSTLYFVSGGPRMLHQAVVQMISENSFPSPWVLSLRNLSQSVPEFKIQKISQIVDEVPSEDAVILFGDDGEKDPETYAELLKKYPDRIDSVYIHRITGRKLPAGEVGYDTPMDVAILEMEKGNLKADQAIRVGKAVLAESAKDDERLVILYNYCPTSFESKTQKNLSAAKPDEIEAYSLLSQIQNRMKKVCEERREDEARRRERSDS